MKKPGLAIAAVFLLTALPALHAAPADPVPVRVSIRGADGKPLDPAYVAFVASSRPGWRPSAEAVAADGVATLRVRPGHYRVIAGAPRHPEEARNVEVREAMQVGFELPRSVPIGGTVVDETGTPIAGARVRHARLLGAVNAAQVTETARRFFESDWSTVTGDDGRWTLPGRANGTVPLYIDAPGYAPVHELRRAGDAEKATTLVRGGMLQLVLDRADEEQMLTLVRSGIDGTTVAREPWEAVAWSRPAAATTITWDSLPAGRYQVIAHPVDPRHFSTPRPVGTFTVNTGATADARASLPRLPRKELEPVVLHVPNRTPKELAALTPFASSPDGADELQYALERVSRGTLVYLLTKAAPEALFLAATDAIITAAPEGDGTMDAPRRTVTWPRADITVRLVRAETAPPLPAWVASEFYGCGPLGRIGLTIAPSQDGVLRLPFPTTCRGVVLRLAPFESLVVAASLTPGERRELGPFTLALGASVAIQVAREPGGAAVPGALVRATTAPGEVHELVFAEGVAGVDGTLLLAGLPAGRDLAIIARDPVTEVTGSAAARAEGGGVTSVRVPLAAPASVVMTLRLGAALRAKAGEARIHSVVLDAPELARSARRSAPLDEKGQVRFDGLSAGKWQPLVLVEAAGTIQPVPLQALTLAAGETRTIDEEVDPPLFEGRVVSRGRGLQSQLDIIELPKPGAIARHVRTDDEGRFRILLPARGIYRVMVRRSLKAEDQIEIGEMAFDDPARPIHIEVPATTLKILVRYDGTPVAGARVSAALTRTTGYGSIGEAMLRGTTDGEGVFRLDGLLPGRWLVQASSGTSERRGAAAVEVKSGDVTVEVELLAPAKLAGTVRDADGPAAGDATVACLHTGAGGLPQVSRTRTDEAGAFTIELPAPPPARLRCGVATQDQRIGTFTTGSVENASVVLRPERGTLTIPDWGTRPAPNTYWLVSPAGDVFDLSWAATRAPALTLSGLPSGPWTIVRATRPDDLLRLATGAASALPSVASFNIRTGEVTTVRLH